MRSRVLGCCSRLKAYVQPDNRNTVARVEGGGGRRERDKGTKRERESERESKRETELETERENGEGWRKGEGES